jgi:hypothetical protein
MNAGFKSHHWDDTEGRPAGGSTFGNGFAISWQNGPLGRGEERKEPNGASVEDIIAAAQDRLEYYQKSQFACDQNREAIDALDEALFVLGERTREREKRRVEGTHAV